MGIDHVESVVAEEGTHRQQRPKAFLADRESAHRHAIDRCFLENMRFCRADEFDMVAAPNQAACFGEDADLLPTPTAGGFRMKNSHTGARIDSVCSCRLCRRA